MRANISRLRSARQGWIEFRPHCVERPWPRYNELQPF